MSDQVAWVDDPSRRTRTLVRGDKVRHINPEMIGAARGIVLAVFADLEHQAHAAVQWKGGALSLTRLHLLAPSG